MPKQNNSDLYGSGIFTTLAICHKEPLFWQEHWKRLSLNAAKIGIDLEGYKGDFVLSNLCELLSQKKIFEGKARITFSDQRTSEIWPSNNRSHEATTLNFLVGERRAPSQHFRLSFAPYPVNSRSPLAGIKSCNYLEPIMSLDEAKARGFHEAIRVNERGFVASACMANVFWLKGGELFTPGLATGCLAGTTREFVLQNIDCREVEVGIEALHNAEAIFLTSAGIGVVQVAEFEGRRLGKVDHPILNLLPY